jgi:hypothetical protein
MYAEERPVNWDWFSSSVVWAYNSSLHPVTGFSPFFLMFGREARQPVDIVQGSWKELKHDVDQYAIEMTVHLKSAYDIVNKRLLSYATDTKRSWDSRVKPFTKFSINDLVMMFKPKLNADYGELPHSQVWRAHWFGPLVVQEIPHKDNPDVYTVRDQVSGRTFTVNAHKLKRYILREYLSSLEEPSTGIEANPSLLFGAEDDVSNTAGAAAPAVTDIPLLPRLSEGQEQIPTEGGSNKNVRRARVTLQEKRNAADRAASTAVVNSEQLREYVVDSILDTRSKNGRSREYLVHWSGYDKNWDTWEPSRCLGPNHAALHAFWATKPISDRPKAYRSRT